jgi:hypothetical protein
MRQPCDECRLLRAELFEALKTQWRHDREREENAPVPFAERLREMTGAEWDEVAQAKSSSKSAAAYRKLRHHQLLCHGGRHFSQAG